jgi:hypothetical protein
MAVFTQVDLAFNVWDQILSVGGLVAVLLALAVFVLWNKLSEKEKALEAINSQISKEAKENMKIITTFEGVIDRVLSEQQSGEKRIVERMKSEFTSVKDLIRDYKKEHGRNA